MVRSFVIWGALVALAGRGDAGSAIVLPHLQEPTAAAPGEARLIPTEKERKTVNGADLPIYNFKADGLPTDKRYSLLVQWMNGKTSEAGGKGIRIDASGNLLNTDGGAIDVMLAPTFPGE